jgi:hypothetical protein
MDRHDVNQRSPIRILERSIRGGLGRGNLGLIMARAGVGKTACLVHIGLDDLLRDRPVLHVALDQTVDDVQAWYDALFDDLARHSRLADAAGEKRRLAGLRHAVAFADHELSPGRLAAAIEACSRQLNTAPVAILIDGYRWDRSGESDNAASIAAYKDQAGRLGAELWMTAQSHRGGSPSAGGDPAGRLPPPFDAYRDLVDVALYLEPSEGDISVRILVDHGAPAGQDARLHLHPDTLRIYAEGEPRDPVAMPPAAYTLLSGGAKGAEAEFGRCAEAWGLAELNFSFAGRSPERERGVVNLSDEELAHGAVSPVYIQAKLHRTFPDAPLFRKMLQSIWHQVNTAGEVFCIGVVQADQTVKGGTGWAAELARHWNKPVHVFDQDQRGWFTWRGAGWAPVELPAIRQRRFCGTGTRFLSDDGRAAIRALFEQSFGPPPG